MTFKTFLYSAALLAIVTTPAHAQETEKSPYNVQLGQAVEFIDGLASATLVDSNTLEPSRTSDGRAVTTAQITGLYSQGADSTIDLTYNLYAANYFDETRFNFVNNAVGLGYTKRLSPVFVGSVRGGVARSFAGSDYDGYYWRGHTGAALAHAVDPFFSIVYGLDVYRYVFDDNKTQNATQVQLSATPSFVFKSIPARLSLVLRAITSNAASNVNSYQSAEILPQFTYYYQTGAFWQVQGMLSRAGFDEADPFQTGVTREDRRYGISLTYDAPLMDDTRLGNVRGYARAAHTRNDSTINRQDYDSSVFSIGVRTSF